MNSSPEDCVPFPKLQRNSNGDKPTREWSELPHELIALIADGLGILDLLSFRGVCKDWNVASRAASAEIESSPLRQPWILLYGESCECLLLSESGERYTINIPELNNGGATCIASNNGWLLLLQNNSIFFFCPFSGAKIYLPKLPNSEFSEYAASFSSPPTSQDCIVSVICQNDTSSDMELYILGRGGDEWTTHKHQWPKEIPPKRIKCAHYCKEEFHFLDDADKLVTFSVKGFQWKMFRIVSQERPGVESIPYYIRKNYFKTDMRQQLGLGEDVSISTCGTVVLAVAQPRTERIIFGEFINASQTEGSEARSLKGVWIQPRFFYVPENQNW